MFLPQPTPLLCGAPQSSFPYLLGWVRPWEDRHGGPDLELALLAPG